MWPCEDAFCARNFLAILKLKPLVGPLLARPRMSFSCSFHRFDDVAIDLKLAVTRTTYFRYLDDAAGAALLRY